MCVCVKVRRHPRESVPSFHVDPRFQTQVFRLAGK